MIFAPALAIFVTFYGLNIAANQKTLVTELKQFNLASDPVVNIIDNSMEHIAESLSDVALVVGRAHVTSAPPTVAFHDYMENSHISKKFPSLLGVGVISFIKSEELAAQFVELNNEFERIELGYDPFEHKGLSNGKQHAILTMFAPLTEQMKPEIGIDVLSRPRKAAYLDAMETGLARVSIPFEIYEGQQAIALFAPFSFGPKSNKGAVATVFEMSKFFANIDSELAPLDLTISLYDRGEVNQPNSVPRGFTYLSGRQNDETSPNTAKFLENTRSFDVGGRRWQLTLQPNSELTNPWAIDEYVVMAALISLLSGLLMYRMQRHSDVLGSVVAKRTNSLRQTAAKLDKERQLAQNAATHDALTGLLNQRGLDQCIVEALARDHASDSCAILCIDLDRFKEINDTTSYQTGNKLLIFVADFLTRLVPEGSLIARFGGDEFLILTRLDEEGARHLALEIVNWANQPQTVDGKVIRFGASIGIAIGDMRDRGFDMLMADANISFSNAKSAGRGQYCVFDEKVKAHNIKTKLLADELRRALEDDEFEPYFQTQHSAADFSISGIECLIRWRHPTRGTLVPAEFLEVAEVIGILGEIDAIALRKSADAVAALEAEGHFIPKLNVNVSLARIRDPELLFAIECLPKLQASLTFEVLETVFIDEVDAPFKQLLEHLKERGIGIEIDDFGSGRASILGLIQIEPSQLKIDRALVMPLLDRPEQKELLQSIVAMGRALQISITAEGVETLAHAKILREIGVDNLQGYFFSKPVPLEDLRRTFQRLAA